MKDFRREIACTQRGCVFGAGFWHPAHTKQRLTPGMVQQLRSGSPPGLAPTAYSVLGTSPVGCTPKQTGVLAALRQIYAIIFKETHKKLSFSNLFFFFPHYLYVFVFHSRNSGGFALSGELLGLAWRLYKGECHSVSYRQDLRAGRAIGGVQWHVGNRRTDRLHHAVSAC